MNGATGLEIVNRIRMEYIEMPDLKLTFGQAQRLWNLSQDACESALGALVHSGFLWRSHDGLFLRKDLGRLATGAPGRVVLGLALLLLAAPGCAQFDTASVVATQQVQLGATIPW